MAREVSTKGIDGIGELIIMAPIKPGFIDAYENITYESRLRFVAEAFYKIELNAREHELFTPFADVAERILTVFNFRIGVLDKNLAKVSPITRQDGTSTLDASPQRYMFLIATYDGPFEPYLRLIWKPLGPFLDLLLCNCEGYKLSTEHGFPEYIDWVRDHLVEPSIFYTTTSNTLRDQLYLSDLEKLQRKLDPAMGQSSVDEQIAAMTAHTAEQRAREVWGDPDKQAEAVRLSFEALNVLYRLADYYPPFRSDDKLLLKAAQDLLLDLPERVQEILTVQPGKPLSQAQKILVAYGITGQLGPYTEHWKWFLRSLDEPNSPEEVEPPRDQVQRGLLNDYDHKGYQTTHGLTLLYSISEPQLAKRTILEDWPISWGEEESFQSEWGGAPIKFYCNVAFTAPGLSAMEVDPTDLKKFPKEFRDGLFQRAPMIGDMRDNHPRRWKFPMRFDADTWLDDRKRPTIHSEEIDVVVQLRISTKYDGDHAKVEAPDFIDFEDKAKELLKNIKSTWDGTSRDEFTNLARSGLKQLFNSLQPAAQSMEEVARKRVSEGLKSKLLEADLFTLVTLTQVSRQSDPDSAFDPGLRLLAIESTFRPLGRYDEQLPDVRRSNRDHFGFIDGISQPEPTLIGKGPAPAGYDNRVPYGDIVCGYRNSRSDTPDDQDWNDSGPWLNNGSFMVIRKIAQFPERLDKLGGAKSPLAHAIVGRTADGAPLFPGHQNLSNDFNYADDTGQEHCPFSAHVRLANPRAPFQGRPSPRILRRGMSYGPRYVPGSEDSKDEPRGVLFMAYNASLAEQYEVIQRWLNGGNPTGVSSAANDPLTGVCQDLDPYTFRYRNAKGVQRAKIDEPLTKLCWGLYAFIPSRSALELICLPKKSPNFSNETAQGAAIIDRTLALPRDEQRSEWKRLLEDFFVRDGADLGQTPPVWRAIRDLHKGVLRIEAGLPYGEPKATHKIDLADDTEPVVLVADKQLILDVMANPADFSSSEREVRTAGSIGSHYVAMDPAPGDTITNPVSTYAVESIKTNEILFNTSNHKQNEVFTAAYGLAAQRLAKAKEYITRLNTDETDIGNKVPFKNQVPLKIDLRRDFLVPVLAGLCRGLFDIPDASLESKDKGRIDGGPWGWMPVDLNGGTTAASGKRKPRCPADFMSPSRFSFYPRPSPAIQDYGVMHGKGLKTAALNLIKDLRALERLNPGTGFKGLISAQLAKAIPDDDDLLARNIVGSMTGAIPPLDANLRGIFFDWIQQETFWRQQSDYLEAKAKFAKDPDPQKSLRLYTECAIGHAVRTAMCKRPAPDLLYRTATRDTEIGDKAVKKGETVILSLISPMLESLDGNDPNLEVVFGGYRKAAWQADGDPTHACPARQMVMAIIFGILAALFESGRIVIQPSSLILQITDWDGPPPWGQAGPTDQQVFEFSPFD